MLDFRTVTVGCCSSCICELDLDIEDPKSDMSGVSGMAVDDPEEDLESGGLKGSVKLIPVAVLISSSLIAVRSRLSAPGMADPGVGGV
jgi:hypothetical protein